MKWEGKAPAAPLFPYVRNDVAPRNKRGKTTADDDDDGNRRLIEPRTAGSYSIATWQSGWPRARWPSPMPIAGLRRSSS